MDHSATKDLAETRGEAVALMGSLMDLLSLLKGTIRSVLHAEDVTPWEATILMMVHRRGQVRLSEVSRKVGIPPSTLTGVVDRLERTGLVRRLRDSADRRGVLLVGTERLAGWASAVHDETERRLAPLLVGLPSDLVPRLTSDLNHLAGALRAQTSAGGGNPDEC